MVSIPTEADTATRERAQEQINRLEALIDVLVAQLAHTDADSARWHQLRSALQADVRLRTGLSRLRGLDDVAAGRIVACVRRWLRRVEPALGLLTDEVDLDADNGTMFVALRQRADERREALRTLRDRLSSLSAPRVQYLAEMKPAWGLGLLPEALREQLEIVDEPLDGHIRAMLTDAEAWCGPRGGRQRAALGLARLAEAALLARHQARDIDVASLFGRYAGAPEVYRLADLRPEHILAFDGVFARGEPLPSAALQAAEHQLGASVASDVRPFFEARMAVAAQLKIALPHRPFDALHVRLGASRMRAVAAAFDAEGLAFWFERMGAEALSRAIVQAGPLAVASLGSQLDDLETMQSVLSAFEPVGHGLGALVKSVPARRLVDLVDAVGAPELQRQVRALGADGLKHLVACVGFAGALVLLSARASEVLLRRLREDLGRRSVRLTLQAAAGTDVARLLRRGMSAQQLQSLMLGAESRSSGLGAVVLGRLATLPGSDAQLQARVATLNEAMAWPVNPSGVEP